MKYSGVILTGNEQAHIAECIENIRPVTNEIIVIDDFSSDGTPQIAEDCGATILQRDLDDNWALQRDFGLDQVSSEWSLMIDADERLNDIALSALANFRPPIGIKVGKLNRVNYYQGKSLRYGWNIKKDPQQRALLSSVRYRQDRPVHEIPDVVPEEIMLIDGAIEHFRFEGWKEIFDKADRYARIEGLSGQISRPLIAQLARHIGRLPIQHAYLDGVPGILGVVAEIRGDFITAKTRRKK